MSRLGTILLSGLLGIGCWSEAQAQAAPPTVRLDMPAPPQPVAVSLEAKSTALLLFDFVDPTCKSQPRCAKEMLPAMQALLERARKAGMFIAYGTRAQTADKWLPEIAPRDGEPVIKSSAQDRFYNTDLDQRLKDKGIKTLILTGWKISGSVLYTSIGATLRDYTVVIPTDTSSAAVDHEILFGQYQILNQNSANSNNEPLKPKASTLTRTELLTLR